MVEGWEALGKDRGVAVGRGVQVTGTVLGWERDRSWAGVLTPPSASSPRTEKGLPSPPSAFSPRIGQGVPSPPSASSPRMRVQGPQSHVCPQPSY